MNASKFIVCAIFFCGPLAVSSLPATAQNSPAAAMASDRDGTHDFDWDIGTWKVHQERRLHPLTGSNTWVHYDGTDTVQKIWDGANTGIVETNGPAGRLEIYTLRLYDPDAHRWNIYFGHSGGGALSLPVVGQFRDGRGEFYDREAYNRKTILVRFRVYDVARDSCRFDQSFSNDGGKTWEVNFTATETLSKT